MRIAAFFGIGTKRVSFVVLSDQTLRSLVTKRGRNSELAEQTVRQAKAFTEKEALDNHLVDLIAQDEKQLMAVLDGREIKRFDGRTETLHTQGAEIVEYRASPRERLVEAIADP